MKQNKFSIIKYPGSKLRFVDLINKEINKVNDCNTYIEPFLGSGSVFLNLEKSFDHYILNDIFSPIIKIYQSIKDCPNYEYLQNFYHNNIQRFGNWGKDKEVYYNFRNTLNQELYGSNSIDEGLFLLYVSRSCINSMMRIGKHGFNQGFGNKGRDVFINEDSFYKIKEKIKNAILLNKEYFYLDEFINDKNIFWFIDPPYFHTGQVYSNVIDKNIFFNFIKSIKGKVIFTNVYHSDFYNELKDWRIIKINDLKNLQPSTNKSIQFEEVMYINY